MNNTIPAVFCKNRSPQSTAADLQRRADSVINSLRPQYVAGTLANVLQLAAWVDEWPTLTETAQTDLIKGDFFRAAHDIKGQGATFGFPLMTALGDHICRRIKAGVPFTPADVAGFALDIADMRTVLEHNLTDDGGVLGQRIRKRLEEM